MSSIEAAKSAAAIADDLLTPPKPSASDEKMPTTYLLRVATGNVLDGAIEWTITKNSTEFTLFVNAGKVVGVNASSHKWMIGKPWGSKIKPWLVSKGFNGHIVVPPVKKPPRKRAAKKGA